MRVFGRYGVEFSDPLRATTLSSCCQLSFLTVQCSRIVESLAIDDNAVP